MEVVFNIPNIITIVRMALTPLFAYLFVIGHYNASFWVYCVISWSDALDGFIARYWKLRTDFGAFIDPLADKLLNTVGFVLLSYYGHIPVWLCVLVMARDAVILITVRVFWSLGRTVEFKPAATGKIATILQLLTVAYALYNASVGSSAHGYFPMAPLWLYEIVVYMTGVFTIISWYVYMVREYKVQYGDSSKSNQK